MTEKPADTEVERDGAAKSVRAKHPLPRWVALIFFAVCLGLIPRSSASRPPSTRWRWRTTGERSGLGWISPKPWCSC